MRKILTVLISLLFLCGCHADDKYTDRAIALRSNLISGKTCSFSAEITADYQSEIYTFALECATDEHGNLQFSVVKPDSITGITGSISSGGGKLTFDDQYLVFAPLIDGWITPVSAPWLFLKALKSGYISGCAKEENRLKIYLNDNYQGDTVDITVDLNENDLPCGAEIFWQGRRVVTMRVENFSIL